MSYCWGPREDARAQLKLTTETCEEYRRAIPLSIMTPVMRDTVLVCRALQIRYVWIDALCIMQDKLSDWEEQSYQMSEIFGNSWLTICTIRSSSCLEGFLKRAGPCETSPSLSYYTSRTDPDAKGSYILRRIQTPPGVPGGIPFSMRAPLSRDLMVSRWNERGWVFQEKNLSPRKAFFGSTMAHFQHRNATRSQSGCVHDEGSVAAAVQFLSRFPLDLSVDAIAGRGRHAPDSWYAVAEFFAGLQWTERLDVFPGLSGIARRFRDVTGSRYAAGLWEDDLHCGLLWRTTHWDRRTHEEIGPAALRQLLGLLSRPQQLAPSWSWAGRDNFEQFLCSDRLNTRCRVRTHLRPEYRLIESRIQVDGANPLGRLRNASLLLSGRVLSLPEGSVPGADVLGKQDWKCEVAGKGLVDILPDWASRNAWDATGISAEEQTKLRLLLISSCCSEWQSPLIDDAHADKAQDERRRDGTSESKSLFWGPDDYSRETLAKGWLKPEYQRSFFQEGEPGFNPATDCPFCSDENRRRDIWGLLIYPADRAGTYYRVGAWYSRAQHGGSEIFKLADIQCLELV